MSPTGPGQLGQLCDRTRRFGHRPGTPSHPALIRAAAQPLSHQRSTLAQNGLRRQEEGGSSTPAQVGSYVWEDLRIHKEPIHLIVAPMVPNTTDTVDSPRTLVSCKTNRLWFFLAWLRKFCAMILTPHNAQSMQLIMKPTLVGFFWN